MKNRRKRLACEYFHLLRIKADFPCFATKNISMQKMFRFVCELKFFWNTKKISERKETKTKPNQTTIDSHNTQQNEKNWEKKKRNKNELCVIFIW